MGLTTGTVTRNGQTLTSAVVIEFRKNGVRMAQATTTPAGVYSIYLPAGIYTAHKMPPPTEIACTPSPLNIPTGTKIQNLDYVE